jgi:hypothetical protein
MRTGLKYLVLAASCSVLTAPTSVLAQAAVEARASSLDSRDAHPQAATGPTARPWWVAGEFHLSILSDLIDRSTLNITFGYAAKSGYRWKSDWGAYLQVEHNLWTETELESTVRQGALNIGAGGERLYFLRRMRAAAAVGISILLYQTALDDPGTTGLFFDVRPTGVRWPLGRGLVMMLDPLTFTVAAPVLGGIPLVQIQYRTVLALEYEVVQRHAD